ncbi:sensor histidine kinase [Actinomadura barringtoniae]|uniref:Sensor histidine kinase n=1 Tax=Actinomadura barringtoniae TaxID=1427535 RepID=A0A939T6C3_9ACTN|nr:sensor histidine kinase [Actinomadura barringtoniae]MBO2448102.1 sensor histidine kinase [Actinomadura barringtoniae]
MTPPAGPGSGGGPFEDTADGRSDMVIPTQHVRLGGDLFQHRALRYRSVRDLVEAALPYLHEGLRADEAVVVITPPPRTALLIEHLGERLAARVEFLDAVTWFQSPVAALAAYYERTQRDWWPRGRLRLLAEPLWTGRSPLEIWEWKRHEAILNVAFAGTPSTIMCAYDVMALPGHILADAARTHPEIVDPGEPLHGASGLPFDPSAPAAPAGSEPPGALVRPGDVNPLLTPFPSERFVDPRDFYDECNAHPLAAPPLDAARRRFAAGELPGLRAFLEDEAARYGLPHEKTLPFVLAVNEVATNVIRQGGGVGTVWLWAEHDELICDVGDPGRTLEDRFLGYLRPRPDDEGNDTMWAVRRLCHIVEIRSGAGGTVIRIHLKLR